MYNALTVAKYIIKRCNDTNRIISNLKLQKLLYFVQAEFLVTTTHACFPEEIEAWDFGPVVPEVYHRYKAYSSIKINACRMCLGTWLIEFNICFFVLCWENDTSGF